MTKNEDEEWLSVEELAERYGYHIVSIRRLIASGKKNKTIKTKLELRKPLLVINVQSFENYLATKDTRGRPNKGK